MPEVIPSFVSERGALAFRTRASVQLSSERFCLARRGYAALNPSKSSAHGQDKVSTHQSRSGEPTSAASLVEFCSAHWIASTRRKVPEEKVEKLQTPEHQLNWRYAYTFLGIPLSVDVVPPLVRYIFPPSRMKSQHVGALLKHPNPLQVSGRLSLCRHNSSLSIISFSVLFKYPTRSFSPDAQHWSDAYAPYPHPPNYLFESSKSIQPFAPAHLLQLTCGGSGSQEALHMPPPQTTTIKSKSKTSPPSFTKWTLRHPGYAPPLCCCFYCRDERSPLGSASTHWKI
ncbi:hypothetical protein C8R45DRAFT_944221 [Mycena sanguinolenta]|nr:hypothetical protein C8R45DRAFT_944221 [Mycena sanguinolenta]